jgi:hypothetical protein
MAANPEIKKLLDNGLYTDRTIREWIKEVAPPDKHKPGRPKIKI